METDGITSAIVSSFIYVEFPFIVQNRVLFQAGFIWGRILLFLSQANVTPAKSDHGFPGRQTGSVVQCSIQAHICQCSVGLVGTCSVSLANCSQLAQVSLLTAAQCHARKHPPWGQLDSLHCVNKGVEVWYGASQTSTVFLFLPLSVYASFLLLLTGEIHIWYFTVCFMHILVGKFLAIGWSQSRYSVRKQIILPFSTKALCIKPIECFLLN